MIHEDNPRPSNEKLRRLHRMLQSYFRSKRCDTATAADLAQEVFVIVEGKIAAGVQLESYEAFAVAVAWNVFKRHLDRSIKRGTTPLDLRKRSIETLFASPSTVLRTRRRVLDVLQALPVEDQALLEARFLAAMKLEECAEMVGVSLATVKRRIAAAQQKFLEGLAEIGQAKDRASGELDEATKAAILAAWKTRE
jgi:RNA polymerase sigma factor (sigma-70 family)